MSRDRRLSDEVPTLRLMTLRNALRDRPEPLVFTGAALVREVRAALGTRTDAIAVVVNDSYQLVGTLRASELQGRHDNDRVDTAISQETPVLRGEDKVDAAAAAMSRSGTDRVVVVGVNDELLGVITEVDLRALALRRK